MKRRLLKWLLDGEDVYVAVRLGTSEDIDVLSVHTDFDGAAADIAGRPQAYVFDATFRVD